MKPIIDRPSFVRSAEVLDRDLLLTIDLFSTIAPPPVVSTPILELTLHDCLDDIETTRALLQSADIWDIEQEQVDASLTLTFHNDWDGITRVSCQRVSSKQRPFEESDWRAVINSYDRLLRNNGDETWRLNRVVRDLELALAQRIERSHRILDQSEGHPNRIAKASGQMKALQEISNILRTSLNEEV